MASRALILLVALTLPSCSALRKAEETLDKSKEVLTVATETVVEVKAKIAEVKAEADTNKDGSVDKEEWLAYLLGLLGLGGGGGIIAYLRSMAADRSKHKALTDELYDRLSSLAVEVARAKPPVPPAG